MKKESRLKHKKGYLLLFAVVISSIVLAIGLGIFNIVNKALILASAGRSSQIAFYASDSGIECALFWDLKHVGLSTTVFATSTASAPPTSGVMCNNEDIASTWTISGKTESTAKTTFNLNLSNGTCATVVVSKTESGGRTKIESSGFNTCGFLNPRRIERAIRVNY